MEKVNKSAAERYAELKLNQEKGKALSQATFLVIIILLLIIGLGCSAYDNYLDNYTFNGKVYNSYEKLMENYPNPADELDVNRFKDIKTYTKKYSEINSAYSDKLNKTVSEYYNISVGEAMSIYTEEYMRRHK